MKKTKNKKLKCKTIKNKKNRIKGGSDLSINGSNVIDLSLSKREEAYIQDFNLQYQYESRKDNQTLALKLYNGYNFSKPPPKSVLKGRTKTVWIYPKLIQGTPRIIVNSSPEQYKFTTLHVRLEEYFFTKKLSKALPYIVDLGEILYTGDKLLYSAEHARKPEINWDLHDKYTKEGLSILKDFTINTGLYFIDGGVQNFGIVKRDVKDTLVILDLDPIWCIKMPKYIDTIEINEILMFDDYIRYFYVILFFQVYTEEYVIYERKNDVENMAFFNKKINELLLYFIEKHSLRLDKEILSTIYHTYLDDQLDIEIHQYFFDFHYDWLGENGYNESQQNFEKTFERDRYLQVFNSVLYKCFTKDQYEVLYNIVPL
jgi:hypothetical protein